MTFEKMRQLLNEAEIAISKAHQGAQDAGDLNMIPELSAAAAHVQECVDTLDAMDTPAIL